MSYPYQVPQKIELNKLGDLYYPALDGMIEVAMEEALKLYPKENWRDVKLCLLQSLVNKVAMKLLIHFKATKPSNADIDGDQIIKEWMDVIVSACTQKNIKSDLIDLGHLVEKQGETIQ